MIFAQWKLIAAGLAAAALAGWFYWSADAIGDKREAEIRQEIAHEDDKAAQAMRDARERVRACYARDGMRWNRETGKCEKRL